MVWIHNILGLLLVLEAEMVACPLILDASIDDNVGEEDLLLPSLGGWVRHLALVGHKLELLEVRLGCVGLRCGMCCIEITSSQLVSSCAALSV